MPNVCILHEVSKLAEQHQLNPLLAKQQLSRDEIAAAYGMVAVGSKGKVLIEL